MKGFKQTYIFLKKYTTFYKKERKKNILLDDIYFSKYNGFLSLENEQLKVRTKKKYIYIYKMISGRLDFEM